MARTVAEFEYLRDMVPPYFPGSMRLKKSVLDLMSERRPYEADEINADRIIHLIGLFAGGLGSAVLIGVALVLLCLLGAVVDHLVNWYSPQYLLARAEYLTLERERKALVRQLRREEVVQRRARLKRWLSGRL